MKSSDQRHDASIPQAEVALIYDRLAGDYDLWARLTESRARRLALRRAGVKDGQATLEVAVGTGLAFLELVRRNRMGNNVGIDISRGMLRKAEKRTRAAGETNFDLVEASALNIPARAESFDLVLNNYMFDLLARDDWSTVIAEFRRVLKPGGRLVLANMTLGERIGSGLFERVAAWKPRLVGGCRGVRLTSHLREGGFNVGYRKYVQQLLFPTEVIVASRAEAGDD